MLHKMQISDIYMCLLKRKPSLWWLFKLEIFDSLFKGVLPLYVVDMSEEQT